MCALNDPDGDHTPFTASFLEEHMNEHPNAAIVRSAYEAFGKGDVAALAALPDDGIVWHESTPSGWDDSQGLRRDESQARQRDELKRLFDKLMTELGASLEERVSLGSTLHEVLDDPDMLIEIAEWESVEARQAVMYDPAAGDALAPGLQLLASPFRDTALQVH
jgi:hypothetical protein